MKRFLALMTAALALVVACDPEETPSEPEEVSVVSIELNKKEITLEKGASETLSVTYTPSNATKTDLVWNSSNKDVVTVTDGSLLAVGPGSAAITITCGNATDICQVIVVVPAIGISIDNPTLELVIGDKETLVAKVDPEGSTDAVAWETSNSDVATVDKGIVTAKGVGNATLTAKAGAYKATCAITVLSFPKGAVDLGIIMTREDGTKYNLILAECNIGAKAPEEYGDYFAWGEVEPYYKSLDPLTWKEGKASGYDWASYKYCNGEERKLTKYCRESSSGYWEGEGNPDGKTILESGPNGDDVASRVLGGKWRMPTNDEINALRNGCNWKWDKKNEVSGCYVINKADENLSIFLPAAGMYYGVYPCDVGSHGNYWSSSLGVLGISSGACSVGFSASTNTRNELFRFLGVPVRPVRSMEIQSK